MELKQIRFWSFRSLADVTLRVTHNCMALVGLNESGKTNLLNGIRTLDNDYKMGTKDKCEIQNETPLVELYFSLEKNDQYLKNGLSNWFTENTLVDFTNTMTTSVITDFSIVRTLNDKGQPTKVMNMNPALKSKKKGLMILKKDQRAVTEAATFGDISVALSQAQIVQKDMLADATQDKYEELTDENLHELLRPVIEKMLLAKVPEVVYWKWDDQYLIPCEITYQDFLKDNDPRSVCIPLYNIFLLPDALKIYDESDLAVRIEEWKKDSGKRKKDTQLLNETLNRHIKDIWKEYDQEFNLSLEAERITLHITDPRSPSRGFYEMEQRSQGFLSFASFLLTISAETRFKGLENYILVLDEPETHLHPSGVRFMRKELLKIAEQGNYVFYATHSVFMVDRKDLTRHVIVKKKHEKTFLVPATKNNVIQEAVLYAEGFGTDRDEFSIASHNLIFEGDLDKELFEFFNAECFSSKKRKYADYQILVGGGVNDIERFIRARFHAPDCKCILILDKDSAGRGIEATLKDKYGSDYSEYYTLEFYGEKNDTELEDLLPLSMVQVGFAASSQAVRTGISTPLLKSDTLIEHQLKSFLSRNNFTQQEIDAFEEVFKDELRKAVHFAFEEIRKKKTRDEKNAAFEQTFPKYSEFFGNLDQSQTN